MKRVKPTYFTIVKRNPAYEISTLDNLLLLGHMMLRINFHSQRILGNCKNLLEISTIKVMTVLIGFHFTAASKVS
jgi:hypothetical protein